MLDWGKLGSSPSPPTHIRERGAVRGDQLMERETEGLEGFKDTQDREWRQKGQWATLLELWAGSIES